MGVDGHRLEEFLHIVASFGVMVAELLVLPCDTFAQSLQIFHLGMQAFFLFLQVLVFFFYPHDERHQGAGRNLKDLIHGKLGSCTL